MRSGRLAALKFSNAGQVCVSPNRFYVQTKHLDRFMARCIDKAGKIKVGPGLEPDTKAFDGYLDTKFVTQMD
jgi:succinate-semialdehyde dehydrogenase/glutarate-semialdehyde dehydrogenase